MRLQGFASTTYHHEYAGSDAHFVMQVGTTAKDTTQLDYYWDRATGMFTTLTATRPAINAQLIDQQRQRWDRYEITQYEFNPSNGQMSRISSWLVDQDGNPVEGSPANPLWDERYAYEEGSPWLKKFVDRQETAYLFDYCSVEGPRLRSMTIQHSSGTPRWGFLQIGYSESENECNGLLPRKIQIGTNPDRTWRLRYSSAAENLAPNLLRFMADLGQPRVPRWSDGSQARYLWEGTRLRAFDDPRALFENHSPNPDIDFANPTYLTIGSARRLWFDYDPPESGGCFVASVSGAAYGEKASSMLPSIMIDMGACSV